METRAGLSAVNGRDHTSGEATKMLDEISKRAVKVASVSDLVELLEKEPSPKVAEGAVSA